MTAAGRIAEALAEQLGGLDPALLARRPPFRSAVAAALGVLPEEAIVDQVVAFGGLAGVHNRYGVIIARLRELPSLVHERDLMGAERAEARRWAAVDRAARRGETLRALVARGDIFADEAEHMLSAEFADADLRGIASAALTGGQR